MQHRTPWVIHVQRHIEHIIEFIKIKQLKIKNMKRFNLLVEATQEKTNENFFRKSVGKELLSLNKMITDLEYDIEVEKDKLETRLSKSDPITKAEIVTLYADIKKNNRL